MRAPCNHLRGEDEDTPKAPRPLQTHLHLPEPPPVHRWPLGCPDFPTADTCEHTHSLATHVCLLARQERPPMVPSCGALSAGSTPPPSGTTSHRVDTRVDARAVSGFELLHTLQSEHPGPVWFCGRISRRRTMGRGAPATLAADTSHGHHQSVRAGLPRPAEDG